MMPDQWWWLFNSLEDAGLSLTYDRVPSGMLPLDSDSPSRVKDPFSP